MARRQGDTVAVVGLGDLGARVVQQLARLPIDGVVAIARNEDRARRVAGQAAIVAALSDGAERVTFAAAEVGADGAIAEVLARIAPSVVVMAASPHSWWRTPHAAAAVPYGAWLPLHVPLVRDVVRARDDAGLDAPVVALPYPDAVGPVLAPLGLAPEVGAGNVAEVAAKLDVLAARRAGVARREVRTRLIAHHAAERLAFAEFSGLAGEEDPTGGGPPPLRASVTVAGTELDAAEVQSLLTEAYPLLSGRETHTRTAAATVATVVALLDEEPRATHVPAPGGRPGGYPVIASRAGVTLDLPDGVSEADAIAINAAAARWDGIERIDAEGTITFTPAVAEATAGLLGRRLERVTVGELDDVAAELSSCLASLGR
jgi:hypothetical protein